MEVVIVSPTGRYNPAANRVLYHVVVEVNEIDHRMLCKDAYQSEGCVSIIDLIEARTASCLANCPIFANRATIHLYPFSMGGMTVFASIDQANVPDTEFPVVDSLPLAFNVENQRHQVGMCVLCQRSSSWNVLYVPVDIVARIFRGLRQHDEAFGTSWLNWNSVRHGRLPQAHLLAARSQPPEVFPPAPPAIFCCVYFHFTLEKRSPMSSCRMLPSLIS